MAVAVARQEVFLEREIASAHVIVGRPQPVSWGSNTGHPVRP